MVEIIFDDHTTQDESVVREVKQFMAETETLEKFKCLPVIIHQDGKSKSFYMKCSIQSKIACPLLDTDAQLDDKSRFRSNRELLKRHSTYKRMLADAKEGREFNDIIVEYNKAYSPQKPLKVWGGQHRVEAIREAFTLRGTSRYHGFKVLFQLSKKQRTDIAISSNTNISVSSDLFDRFIEETLVGNDLRNWCYKVGLLDEREDFPDKGSTSEVITIKLARSFVTNFCKGMDRATEFENENLLYEDIYEPYLCKSGATLDPEYEAILSKCGNSIWRNAALAKAGCAFASLHKAQYRAVTESRNTLVQ